MSVFNKIYPPGSVLRCPTAAENDGSYDLPSSAAYTLSSLVRTTNDGRRGECPTLAAVRRGFVFHSSRLVRLTTLYTCIQRSQIFVQNRVFAYPTAFDAPVRGFPSEYRHPVWHGKTRVAWLPDGEKNFEDIFFSF